MNLSKQLKKTIIIVPKTNLILQEFLAVLAGRKPVLTLVFSNKSEKDLIKSNFPELAIICHYRIVDGKKENICAISKNKSLAAKTVNCIYKGKEHNLIGQLLGYPECCIKNHSYFFQRNLQHSSPIVTYQSYQNSKQFNFLTNNLLNFSTRISNKEDFEKLRRYYGLNKNFPIPLKYLQFISHIPCSYNCRESIKLGKEVDGLLKKYIPNVEKIVRYTLSKPILFFDIFKLVIFDGYFEKGVLYYKKVIPPFFLLDNLLMKKIKDGNKIIVNKQKITIFKDNLKLFSYQKKNKTDGFILNFSENE
jgi:hypothetical protein